MIEGVCRWQDFFLFPEEEGNTPLAEAGYVMATETSFSLFSPYPARPPLPFFLSIVLPPIPSFPPSSRRAADLEQKESAPFQSI